MAKPEDLEDAMLNLEEREARDSSEHSAAEAGSNRIQVGTVDHFFDKVGVAAVVLTGSLKVGDMIEIEKDTDVLRMRVSSMQIDRRDVETASSGDSVGIKTETPVARGSIVYRVD
ncbi:MAG: translation elongation factor-like protein [Candidatus Marsarchaeota archaeon]|nr:translation elongation factor-like protein [Candidatus Marsarchaeota archaeon]MCL5115227.1 translation elongation factor-like protein [Candidatus Marsarchaeota archaeon]